MKTIYDNEYEEIRRIISERARYQKVMILYDNSVSNIELMDISNSIKDLCVFNKMNISSLDMSEIYDGYKVLIFVCETNSYLLININIEEFINIFIPTDGMILPYFLSYQFEKKSRDDYLIQKKNKLDISAISSISFNKFFHYFKSFFTLDNYNIDFTLDIKEFTKSNIISEIESVYENVEFEDVKIIQSANIDYQYLGLVDLILINAISLLITASKNRTHMIVDVYKSAREEYSLIDKFYAMTNNDAFMNIINMNYTFLKQACNRTKEKILLTLDFSQYSSEEINRVFDKIKNYCKYDNGYLSYLYLYNIFDV